MKLLSSLLLLLCIGLVWNSRAQDTFSMVAIDSVTGEVGSIGASCVDLSNFPQLKTDFLGELFPGRGAINTQAWYRQENQATARDRMLEGDSAQGIIDWVTANDIDGQPERRQYGVVTLDTLGRIQSAAHTGSGTDDYKGHILGPNYSIQGNILLGREVLDSMEARFLRAEGNLACRLMQALEGARMVGADSRCAPNGTSSLFAFLKVAQPGDVFGSPGFLVSVRTANGSGIEPIDSLRVLFDKANGCATQSTKEVPLHHTLYLYPNPGTRALHLSGNGLEPLMSYTVYGLDGQIRSAGEVHQGKLEGTAQWPPGLYYLRISGSDKEYYLKWIKE